jgi:lysophospholipase L1-like esterase
MITLFKDLLTFLLLPVMYVQGKQVRKSIPELPEAQGPEGIAGEPTGVHKNILLLGESTLAGVGVPTHQEGFAGALGQSLASRLDQGIQWKVYARSGYTARRVTDKLIPKMAETETDLIIIGLGGNDTFTLNKHWTRDIENLITTLRLKYHTTPLVFINLPPVAHFPALPKVLRFCLGHHMDKLRAQLTTIVREKTNCYFLDEKITIKDWAAKYVLENKPEFYFSDGIHPTKLTYRVWAQNVAEYITKNQLI